MVLSAKPLSENCSLPRSLARHVCALSPRPVGDARHPLHHLVRNPVCPRNLAQGPQHKVPVSAHLALNHTKEDGRAKDGRGSACRGSSPQVNFSALRRRITIKRHGPQRVCDTAIAVECLSVHRRRWRRRRRFSFEDHSALSRESECSHSRRLRSQAGPSDSRHLRHKNMPTPIPVIARADLTPRHRHQPVPVCSAERPHLARQAHHKSSPMGFVRSPRR